MCSSDLRSAAGIDAGAITEAPFPKQFIPTDEEARRLGYTDAEQWYWKAVAPSLTKETAKIEFELRKAAWVAVDEHEEDPREGDSKRWGEKPVNSVSGNTMMAVADVRKGRAEFGRPVPRSAPSLEEPMETSTTIEREQLLVGSQREPLRGGCAAEVGPETTAEPPPDPPSFAQGGWMLQQADRISKIRMQTT